MTTNTEQLLREWRIDYDNDSGNDDGAFWEWWTLTDGVRSFKCDSEADAQWLQAALTQPAQPAEGGEAVAWMTTCADGVPIARMAGKWPHDEWVSNGWTTLYTAPPASQEQAKWSEYVAGMVWCWIQMQEPAPAEDQEDRYTKAIAGIIERRLWALKREASQEQAQQPSEPHHPDDDDLLRLIAEVRDIAARLTPGLADDELMQAIGGPSEVPGYIEAVINALKAQQPSGGEVDDTIARLMKFYDADNLQSLALAQCKHVERLQAKLPRIDMPVFTRVREG